MANRHIQPTEGVSPLVAEEIRTVLRDIERTALVLVELIEGTPMQHAYKWHGLSPYGLFLEGLFGMKKQAGV